jgi:hypothetical protein
MIISPGAGALAMSGVIAGYAIVFGVLLIGFRVRSNPAGKPATA